MYLYNDLEEERDALGFILYYNGRIACEVRLLEVVGRGARHDIFCRP